MNERRIDGRISYQFASLENEPIIGDAFVVLDWAALAFSVELSYNLGYSAARHSPPTAEYFAQAFNEFLLSDYYEYTDFTGESVLVRYSDGLGPAFVVDVELRPDPAQNSDDPDSQVFDVVLHTSKAGTEFMASEIDETDVKWDTTYKPIEEDLAWRLEHLTSRGENNETFRFTQHEYSVGSEHVEMTLDDDVNGRRRRLDEAPSRAAHPRAIVHAWDPPTDAIRRWVAMGIHIDRVTVRRRLRAAGARAATPDRRARPTWPRRAPRP